MPDDNEAQYKAALDLLRGASPADMPIQQPTEFELIINRKLIRATRLTVPQFLLLQATEVLD
jgi:putative ABC transport system substrate-binding protein